MSVARKVIQEAWRDSDGYWIALRNGYCDAENPQCHQIHEDTRREAMAHNVERCDCRACAKS